LASNKLLPNDIVADTEIGHDEEVKIIMKVQKTRVDISILGIFSSGE